jgi:hypothetical protein
MSIVHHQAPANMNLPEVLRFVNLNFTGAGEAGLAGNHTGKKDTMAGRFFSY